jgi:hypothetical protein
MNELGSIRKSNRLMLEVAIDPLRSSLNAAQVLGRGLDQLQLRARRSQVGGRAVKKA